MRFNMETAYVPYTSVFEQKDMMYDWKNTSNRSAISGFIVAVFSFFTGWYCSDFGDFFEFSMYGASVALALGGIYCKKWKLPAYYLNIIAMFYCNCIAGLFITRMPLTPKLFMLIVNLAGIPMTYFCLRCICNYRNVFLELKKCKGFPSFIVNSQDLYGDKIYLKDKDETPDKKPVKATVNPIVMNIGVNPTKEEIDQRKKKKHKHSLSILGINIIFPHDDPQDMDFNDKKGYMYDWNCNVELARNGNFLHIFLMMAGTLFSVIGSGGIAPILLGYGAILLLILGTNYMKMGELFGAFMTIGAVVMYFATSFYVGDSGKGIPLAFILAISLINIKILLPTIRYIINYPMYKELSTHEGFPSFVRNYADLYGDKLYIVEKMEPVKRRVLSDNEKIEMNIGFDEKPKKEDKGWNAFDYMDEEREENNEN